MPGRTILKIQHPLPDNRDTINVAGIYVEVKLKDDDAASEFTQEQDRVYWAGLKKFSSGSVIPHSWPQFKQKKKLDASVTTILTTCKKQLEALNKGTPDAKAYAKKKEAILLDARRKLGRACFMWAKELKLEASAYYGDLLASVGPGDKPEPIPEMPKEPVKPVPKRNETEEEYEKRLGAYDEEKKAFPDKRKEWAKNKKEKEEALKKAEYSRTKKAKPGEHADKFKVRMEPVPGKKQPQKRA